MQPPPGDLALRRLPSQVKRVNCESSGCLVPKDKAVARFIVRNIVESAAIRDLQESCVFDCARPATTAAATACSRSLSALREQPALYTRRQRSPRGWPAVPVTRTLT